MLVLLIFPSELLTYFRECLVISFLKHHSAVHMLFQGFKHGQRCHRYLTAEMTPDGGFVPTALRQTQMILCKLQSTVSRFQETRRVTLAFSVSLPSHM